MKKKLICLCLLLAAVTAATVVFLPSRCESPLHWEEEARCLYAGDGYYPRMTKLQDGTLLCGFDTPMGTPNACIAVIRSTDGGSTWSPPVIAARKPGYDCANANFLQLENGDLLLAYRAIRGGENIDAKILCDISHDNGLTWQPHSTIIETYGSGGVWEPHLIMLGDKLAVFYSNDSQSAVGSTGLQNIEFKLWEGEAWSEKHIASKGNETGSRDGMPVVDRLSDGRYVLVAEANAFPDYVFVIQLKFSPDGLDWSEPFRTIAAPKRKGADKRTCAPYICVLPGDVLAVSYQTDEDARGNGDGVCRMKVIVSEDLGRTWSKPFVPFPVPDGRFAAWNGMYWDGVRLFALTGANHPNSGIFARVATLVLPENPEQSP